MSRTDEGPGTAIATSDQHTDGINFDCVLDRSHLSTVKWEMEIEQKGDPSLLCLGTAEMDFKAAPPILDALARVARTGHFGYPYKPDSYYESVIGFFARNFGWHIERPWIANNVGIYPSMHPIIEELTNPGDEIIYQTPVHHIFQEVIACSGRTPVANPLRKLDGRYEMDLVDLANKVTKRTKLLLLCSPHNPVGRVWSSEELLQLHQFCLDRGIVVISDEVYFGLIYNDVKFVPFASVSHEASTNSITVLSTSKSFNLAGLKHSLVIAENPALLDAYKKGLMKNNLYFGGCIFGQAATEAAFREGDSWLRSVMDYVEGNFSFVENFLRHHFPEVAVTRPEATYFAWLDCSRLAPTSEDLRQLIEDQARIAVTYGEALGPGGEGHIRLNLATSRSTLAAGLDRLATAAERQSSVDCVQTD